MRTDLINMVLILVALLIAFLMPFNSFIVAYAVLGPLHYLTEINWLNEKNYFTSPNKLWLIPSTMVVAIISLPKLANYLGLISTDWLYEFMLVFDILSNPLLILSLWSAAVLVLVPEGMKRNIGLALGLIPFVGGIVFPTSVVIVGAMLPTLIHVYAFTILFMLYGAAKSNAISGLFAALMVLAVPLFIAYIDIDKDLYSIPQWTKSVFVESKFHLANLSLAKLLGFADGKNFFFYGSWELKVQRFVAFAYIYHYLNWFSKTAIIGWHEGLSGKRVWIVVGLWLAFVLLFAIDYRLGFYSVLSLSFLHVVLEFPLNVLSIKGIAVWAQQKLR